ncbi:hypothetical protein ACINK0_18245 (plasmid) [Deinococcus sp. VB343]|uniref:Uncharacterized protein n=1 Tax=Deinococcus sp. VB142 TaxID=3112952 RepID=A0AAU6Q7P7_9DEIO
MKHNKHLFALILVALYSAASAQPLIGSQTSFAQHRFCQQYQCRFVESHRSLNEAGGYWTKEYFYQLSNKAKVSVLRYDDPSHPRQRGNVMGAALDFRGMGPEAIAVQFASLTAGRTITARQLETCFQAARKASGRKESWVDIEKSTLGGIGIKCSLEDGWMKRLSVAGT